MLLICPTSQAKRLRHIGTTGKSARPCEGLSMAVLLVSRTRRGMTRRRSGTYPRFTTGTKWTPDQQRTAGAPAQHPGNAAPSLREQTYGALGVRQSASARRRKQSSFDIAVVMPALVAGIHVLLYFRGDKDVDGRVKPGHDARMTSLDRFADARDDGGGCPHRYMSNR